MLIKILELLGRQKHQLKFFLKTGDNVKLPNNGIIQNKEKIEIGDHFFLGSFPAIYATGGLKIGSNVIIGPNVTIHTTSHNYESNLCLPYDHISKIKKVTIGDNVWIGANVSICPGVKIAEGSVVGMGSVVTKDVEVGSVVGGNPAVLIKKRNLKSYEKLKKEGKFYMKLKGEGRIQTKYI